MGPCRDRNPGDGPAVLPGALDHTQGKEEADMWRCTVCGYIYDEAKEGKKFSELPDDWTCPVCNAPKDAFMKE
jgi:rubredoxin